MTGDEVSWDSLGGLVVSWEDEPGRAFARPSAFRLPDRKAAPGGES